MGFFRNVANRLSLEANLQLTYILLLVCIFTSKEVPVAFFFICKDQKKSAAISLSLKERPNESLAEEFHKDVKIFPSDVCGSAGFAYP